MLPQLFSLPLTVITKWFLHYFHVQPRVQLYTDSHYCWIGGSFKAEIYLP